MPVPRLRVPYSVAIAVAWFCELFADHLTGRAPKATVTGVRLAKRIMHFDSSRTARSSVCDRVRSANRLPMPIAWLRESGHLPRHVSRAGS